MAPADWEISMFKFIEENDEYYENNQSVKNDLKAPYKLAKATNFVIERKAEIYGVFSGDVKDWLFSPPNENDLITYLSNQFVDYQNYRNGFANELKLLKSQDEFKKLNNFIRTDYIRATHHIRIESYVKNLEILFGNSFEQPAWGKRLAADLAMICRSHGEDISYLSTFSNNAQYYGLPSANLQFIGMMLRLGDIIHFSFDRAPTFIQNISVRI